jgi:alpha-D-xyloside xylohydrolase
MRPLFVDFPGDSASWEVEDQFLFGDDILVAPVYTEGARTRRVYLPAGPEGTTWRDAWTGTEHPGGEWITAPAPLDTIPVYLRGDGQVEPFGPPASLGPSENSGE